jgi:hypothetical protein
MAAGIDFRPMGGKRLMVDKLHGAPPARVPPNLSENNFGVKAVELLSAVGSRQQILAFWRYINAVQNSKQMISNQSFRLILSTS